MRRSGCASGRVCEVCSKVFYLASILLLTVETFIIVYGFFYYCLRVFQIVKPYCLNCVSLDTRVLIKDRIKIISHGPVCFVYR